MLVFLALGVLGGRLVVKKSNQVRWPFPEHAFSFNRPGTWRRVFPEDALVFLSDESCIARFQSNNGAEFFFYEWSLVSDVGGGLPGLIPPYARDFVDRFPRSLEDFAEPPGPEEESRWIEVDGIQAYYFERSAPGGRNERQLMVWIPRDGYRVLGFGMTCGLRQYLDGAVDSAVLSREYWDAVESIDLLD